MIYAINIAAVILYGIITRIIFREKWKSVFIFIATIHLALFHALRNPFDYPDNALYYDAYKEISGYDFKECFFELHSFTSWEPGYVLLNFLLSHINPNPSLLFICSSVFMVVGNMMIIKKLSYNPLLSVLIYMIYPLMFGQSLFVLRQHIATVFVLLSVLYVNQSVKSLIYILLAISFHYSAIVILPFILFYRKLFELQPIRLCFIALSIIIAGHVIMPFIVELFPRFAAYTERENNIIPFIILSSLFLLHIINGSLFKARDCNDRIILGFLLYGVLISLLMLGVPGGGRLTNYLIYILPVAFPLLFKLTGLASNFIFKVIYSMAFFCLIIYLCIDSNIFLYNYSFFWEEHRFIN